MFQNFDFLTWKNKNIFIFGLFYSEWTKTSKTFSRSQRQQSRKALKTQVLISMFCSDNGKISHRKHLIKKSFQLIRSLFAKRVSLYRENFFRAKKKDAKLFLFLKTQTAEEVEKHLAKNFYWKESFKIFFSSPSFSPFPKPPRWIMAKSFRQNAINISFSFSPEFFLKNCYKKTSSFCHHRYFEPL